MQLLPKNAHPASNNKKGQRNQTPRLAETKSTGELDPPFHPCTYHCNIVVAGKNRQENPPLRLHIHPHLHQTQGNRIKPEDLEEIQRGKGEDPDNELKSHDTGAEINLKEEEDEEIGITMDDEEIAKNCLPLSSLTLAKK